jgi:hypothetical protein
MAATQMMAGPAQERSPGGTWRGGRPHWLIAGGTALCAFVSTALAQRGGYDLLLYERMAQRALAGGNPYVDPYADFPPLKMLLFSALGRLSAWSGFGALVAAAVAVLATLLLLRRASYAPSWWVVGLLPVALPALFLRAWVQPWEDKGVCVALLLGLLLAVPDLWRGDRTPASPARLLGAGVLAGLLQGYGGAGLLVLPLLLAWPLSGPRRDWRGAALLAGSCLVTVTLCHVPYWPHWPAGYALRAARMHMVRPQDAAIWLLPWRLWHLYNPAWPMLLLGAGALMAAALFLARRISLHDALAFAAFALMACGPEASVDRILAGTLPVLYLVLDRRLVALLALALLSAGSALVVENTSDPGLLLLVWSLPALAVAALLTRPRPGGPSPHAVNPSLRAHDRALAGGQIDHRGGATGSGP